MKLSPNNYWNVEEFCSDRHYACGMVQSFEQNEGKEDSLGMESCKDNF